MDIISHLEIEKKQIKMDSDRVFYCSVSPFTNKQFIEKQLPNFFAAFLYVHHPAPYIAVACRISA